MRSQILISLVFLLVPTFKGAPLDLPAPSRHNPPFPQAGPTPDVPHNIQILCLYGSVPAKGYWKVEPFHGPHNMINWVAKLHGGLAASGHFLPNFRKRNFNSCFRTISVNRMWNCLGNHYNNIDSLRRAVFVIPITAAQWRLLDSLVHL